MYDNLLAQSPEDKLKNYAEVNKVALPTGYVNYTPNDYNPVSYDFMSKPIAPVDITKTLDNRASLPPILAKPKPVESTRIEKLDDIPKPKVEPTQPVAPLMKSTSATAKEAYDYYVKQKNLAPHVAAGIVGNLYHESGLKTDAIGDGGTSTGIAQWHGGRWTAFKNWALTRGKNINDLHTQLDYVLAEPGQEHALAKTLAAKDVDEATMTFGKEFERPNEKMAAWDKRKAYALHLFNN